MILQLTSEQVWKELERELFAVLGVVTPSGEARTAGIVYAVRDKKVYIASDINAWKVRHIRHNPHVSLTVTIAKQIPFLPWIKVPAATITFSGCAVVRGPESVSKEVIHSLLRGLEVDAETLGAMCVIEVEPLGDFVTYGVGIPLMTMRHPDKACGRAPVAFGRS